MYIILLKTETEYMNLTIRTVHVQMCCHTTRLSASALALSVELLFQPLVWTDQLHVPGSSSQGRSEGLFWFEISVTRSLGRGIFDSSLALGRFRLILLVVTILVGMIACASL